MQMISDSTLRRLRLSAGQMAILVGAVCLLILTGWILHWNLPATLGAGTAATSVPTASAFLLCAALLYRLSPGSPAAGRQWLSERAGAVALILFGLWALTGYAIGQPDAGYLFGSGLGQVSPATAVCFLLLGCGLLTLRSGMLGYVVPVVSALGLLLCAQAITTYAYSAEALYAFAVFAAMSLPTALIFTALFIALALVEPFPGWMGYIVSQSSGGQMARRLLPAVVLVPFLLGLVMARSEKAALIEPAFGFALMAVVTASLLTIAVCFISASLARTELDLRHVNESLRNSEHAARAIVDTALDAFLQTDEQGRITEWNQQAEKLFGWNRNEVLGCQVEDIVMSPALRTEAVIAREKFLRTGETTFIGRILECQMNTRDGTLVPVEMAATALPQSDALFINWFIRDLRDKKALDEQLRHAQKMEAVGSLTGGLAHDFNNILGVVVGNLDLLEERLGDDGEAREILSDALSAALSGSELTRRLLAFARRQPLAPEQVDVSALLAGMVPMLVRTLGGNIRIEFDPGRNTWPVKVDPTQLESAILNLCTNARDAMPKGGRLTVATENGGLDSEYVSGYTDLVAGEYVVIAVTDSGIGIPKESLGRIFEPFYTTKETGKGTGLGLSMVFGFMKQSGGHVNVYSEPGLGTTFRLYLPRLVGAQASAAPAHAAAEKVTGGGETVLVVEDNEDVRHTVLRQLESLGYSTIPCADTDEALKALEAGGIDLVFTDVVMPGHHNGLDLAWLVRERWPGIAIVLTSGFPRDHVHDRNDRMSGFPLLGKPYRKADLAKTIREALDKHHGVHAA